MITSRSHCSLPRRRRFGNFRGNGSILEGRWFFLLEFLETFCGCLDLKLTMGSRCEKPAVSPFLPCGAFVSFPFNCPAVCRRAFTRSLYVPIWKKVGVH